MIHITGDLHIPYDIAHITQGRCPPTNYLIVLGDFGLIWKGQPDPEEIYWTEWFNKKEYTTLFLPGNHENYERLNTFPDVPLFDSTVKQISDKIYMLKTAHLYTIENKTIFTFGGATSTDKEYRTNMVDWWEDEVPTQKEYYKGYSLLHSTPVDYILTHTLPSTLVPDIFPERKADPVSLMLQDYFKIATFKHWYCGHFHMDIAVHPSVSIVYSNILHLS